jgi:hypothetical protein
MTAPLPDVPALLANVEMTLVFPGPEHGGAEQVIVEVEGGLPDVIRGYVMDVGTVAGPPSAIPDD